MPRIGRQSHSVHLYLPVIPNLDLVYGRRTFWGFLPTSSVTRMDPKSFHRSYIRPCLEGPVFSSTHPVPSPSTTAATASFDFTTNATGMAPSTPTKVHFLDPTSNAIIELEPLTPPVSIPPSPHLGTIDLPPTSPGYSTPTSPAPIERPLLHLSQQTRIHRALYRANDLQFDAGMTLQPCLTSHGTSTGRSSPLFEHDAVTLAEAATFPPLPSILLVCDHFPWKIRVSSSLPNLFVTNYDVLQTIHLNLRTPVAAAEWFLCGSAQDREVILQTFERRVRRLSNEFSGTEEGARMVRRVDCLMGLTRLVRITPSEDPEVFVMEWGWP